ncbi:MAG: hypothetical protein VKK97_08780 [Synechococcaceae cyanobacterium]|nr:hypothetical protein [Synechococcaceae cyanobacterium]
MLGLVLGSALVAAPPHALAATEAEAGLEARLARPGCRAALGLAQGLPAAQLLRQTPDLAARLAATPACRHPEEEVVVRLERLERELEASRQRVAAQQAQLVAETARQNALAQDLAQLRRQLGPAPAAPSAPAPGPAAAGATPTAAAPPDPLQYTPGKGFTLQAGGSSLRLSAEARLLGFSTSRYTFNPGQPLVVSPRIRPLPTTSPPSRAP